MATLPKSVFIISELASPDREDRGEGLGKMTLGRAAQQSFKWQVSVQVSYYGLGLTDAPLQGLPDFYPSLGVGTCIGPLAAASADVSHHYTNRAIKRGNVVF